MPLLWIPLTKRMAVIPEVDVVLRCQLHAIVAATPLPESIVICHRGFRGDSPGMDLATLDTRADGITALAKERLVPPHCPQIWGDV
jgi:hypothetical protein